MSRSKHSEAQILAELKQVGAARTADDVARECGVSKHTIYAWNAKFVERGRRLHSRVPRAGGGHRIR